MEMSSNVTELATALAKAQGEMENAKKSTDNNYFKSKYADLAEVWNVVREPLAKNGLSVIQGNEGVANGYMTVTTLLLHSSGQFIKMTGTFPVGKQDPQGAGSALTYARRYSLAAVLGIAQEGEDDDGNAACGKQNEPQTNGKRQQVQTNAQQHNNAPEANQQPTGDKYVQIWPDGSVAVAVNAGKDKNGRPLAEYRNIREVPVADLEKMVELPKYKLAHKAIQNVLAETAA